MKAFIASVTVIALLVLGVILGSSAGIRAVEGYLAELPDESSTLPSAALRLEALGEQVLDDLLLLNSLFPHDRADELNAAIARATAAAEGGDGVEYAIQRAELESILRELRRDLMPHLADIV